jgi:hypothetical protein
MNLTFQSPKSGRQPRWQHMACVPKPPAGDIEKPLRVLQDAAAQFPGYDAETIGEFEQAR